MRPFLRQLAAFLSIQASICVACALLGSSGQDEYVASILDKQALLGEAPGQRLILVGGSNLAFGIDSRRLHEELGYHPVNMGVHAGFGLPFMLNQVAASELRSGDVVVASMEYNHFGASVEPDVVLVDLLVSCPSTFRHLDPVQYGWCLDHGLGLCSRSLRKAVACVLRLPAMADVTRALGLSARVDVAPPYSRGGFNEFGDLTSHWSLPRRRPMVSYTFCETTRALDDSIDRLNRFHESCRTRGVKVYYAYPPVEQSHFEANRDVIARIAARMRERLTFPILNAPEDVVMNEALFFDTIDHLMAEGAACRTSRLISDLRRQRATPASPHFAIREPRHTVR